MPDSSGFADAPVTRVLLFYLVAASLVVSLADVKDLVDLRVGRSHLAVDEGEESKRWLSWVLQCVCRLGIWQVGALIFNFYLLLVHSLTLFHFILIFNFPLTSNMSSDSYHHFERSIFEKYLKGVIVICVNSNFASHQ